MKKLLSVLLVCLLCLGCGVSAAALEEGEVEVETQGLMNPLPVVTAIEAEWSGEILIGHIMYALFTPENVTITAYYEDGEPEVLSRWEEIGIDWWWRVFPWSFDDSATFLYSDSNLQSAYYEVHGNFTNYYESLPQASIEFPENYVERYIETQMPLTAMKLGEMMTVQTLDAYRPQVLSFTPETSGWYSFENPWLYFSDFIRVMVIMDSNYEFLYHLHGLPSNDRNHFSRVYFLEVGQEYYIFARKSSNYFSYPEKIATANFVVKEYSFGQSIKSMLSHWILLLTHTDWRAVMANPADYPRFLNAVLLDMPWESLDLMLIPLRIIFGF